MARTRRLKREGDAHYHVMSRTNARSFILSDPSLKRGMVRELERVAAFSGVRINAYCLMDDHFHIVCSVVKPEKPLSECEILERIAILKGSDEAAALALHWADLRQIRCGAAVEEELERWRRRMHDVSEFVKLFKERVDRLYKRTREHCGSLWSGRFKSTCIEDGRYLATCVRYVELNPVRAGMVRRARDYAFSSQNSESAALYASHTFKGPGPSEPLKIGQFEGPGPNEGENDEELERALGARIAQIGDGLVFGSRMFVLSVLEVSAECFHGQDARPRRVLGRAFAARGQRLARV